MRWDSWNELSKIPWDLWNSGSGIKSFGKSFVIDGDRKRGMTHRHTHTHPPAILGVWTVAELSDISPLLTISSCLPRLG